MMALGNPRHILLFAYWLGHGGAEQHTLHLARAFAKRGDEVTVAYVDRDPGEWIAEEPYRAVDLHLGRPLRRYASVHRISRLAALADVIHCTGWDASAWGRIAAAIARRPVIVTDHASARRATQRSLGGRVPNRPLIALHNRVLDPITHTMVAVAGSQVEALVREGVKRSKIVVIPNGVALEPLRRSATHGATRAELRLPPQARVVVQIARFIPEKRQEWSYNAVRALRPELGDVRLLFVGDGPELAALERRARAEGADWVQFLGQRSDVGALLALSDLAVLPSRAEALPMVMIEALAIGVPQVATDAGDMGAVLRESGAGIVVDRDDDVAFTGACRAVLVDSTRAHEMRLAAQPAAERFGLDRMITAYDELFDRVLATSSRGRRTPSPAGT